MEDLYTLEDIAARFALESTHAARKRVHAIMDVLEKRGAVKTDRSRNGALCVTPEGLLLLEKFLAFDGTIQEKAEQLKIELGEIAAPPDPDALMKMRADMKRGFKVHRDEIKDLKERVMALEEARPWWAKLTHFLGRPRQSYDE